MRKIITALIFVLAITASAMAAGKNPKWETMSFTEDIAGGIEALNAYCQTHELKLEDVLWANKTDQASLKAGMTIFLPKDRADMLAIWQRVGAWEPTALVPVVSEAAAKRAMKSAEPAPKGAGKSEEITPAPAPAQAIAQTPKEETQLQADLDLKAEHSPAPARAISAKKLQDSPARSTTQTPKPDKVLTAKKKSPQQEIPGLMDPIIILSPNGDPTNGPMRLIISGDKVEVVKLPQNALPKKPTMTDASAPFTSSYSYLPYYDLTGRPRANIMTNLNNFTSLNGKMMWPVDGKISSPFGKWRGKHKHEGIDIPMPSGTPIRAAKNGVVIRTGNNSTMGFRGYGNFVMLDHGGGVRTFYAHCQSVAVRQGQRIMQGQIIGYVGNTGRSTASHLHFEVRINDTKVNPVPYLAGNTHLASHK